MAIIEYYDENAAAYDASRFANSYGHYLDAIERRILRDYLRGIDPQQIADFGCGTGRLLGFAGIGVDGSAAMLAVAAGKFTGRTLLQAHLSHLPLQAGTLQAGICFHVLMHLEPAVIQAFLAEAARVLVPGGKLVVDVLSAPRRALSQRKQAGWHGNTAFSLAAFETLSSPHWKLARWQGIMLLPIHRVPRFARAFFAGIDYYLCRTFLARYASYYAIELERSL